MADKSLLYTKTGDKGETSLVSGARLSKADARIDLYGEVDELNSQLGVIVAMMKNENFFDAPKILAVLKSIQSNLFNLGSFLACESENWEKFKLAKIDDEVVSNLEEMIDFLDGQLPKLKNFILPGGSLIAAHTHVSRTVCRRVERKLVAFINSNAEVPDNSLTLLNRLSDFLFVMARYFNLELKEAEIIWEN